MGKRLTGLTPSDQLAAQCPTCRGDQRILMWVAATCPDEDDQEITRGTTTRRSGTARTAAGPAG